MKLSIVTTLYCSASHITEFYQRSTAVARQFAGDDYEIILVNDGSPDNSCELAVKLAETDNHLVIIDLSRNFGHHKAIMTGLNHVLGDYIFLLDSDLEEEPEWLLSFFKQMERESCDVVYGVQEQRKGGVFERKTGELFYKFFGFLSSIDLPKNIITARLMSRRYVAALVQHLDREVFLAGLWQITGFTQMPLLVNKHCTSQTTYDLRKKIAVAVNSITSFSNTPLTVIFYLGILISFFAALYVAYLIVNRIIFSTPLDGWTSVMASIWLLGGMIISFIGVIGIYLAKIFSESKQRPYTIIRKIYGRQ